ncbi:MULTISPECIES: PaaI family thioesterase [unclassified Iodidimonas]|jgi:uncharacterized protein (TIGR00369 family)|uniref:PaaI family thioesterase n=1 Tax=unclassified Iodidimonas TaxID=2626145 RepID=UPI0024825C16|nr:MULTISPECIES: PaaI family thioesterase [unclassified Iodidimonas]
MAEAGASPEIDKTALIDQMIKMVPQMAALGIHLIAADGGRARMQLPWSDDLVAYADTGVMAGGAIFTLLDSVLGMAVFSALDRLLPVATLDLRIDYLKPATPGLAVLASSHCTRLTRQVAFVRGVAFHEDEGDAIAHATASFIIDRGHEKGGR